MQQNANNNFVDLGCLWKRKSKKGESFLSGVINLKSLGFDKNVDLIIFTNKTKNGNEKAPDLRIYESKPREGYTKPSSQVSATKQPVQKPQTPTVQEEELI